MATCHVLGVGITKFNKPSVPASYTDLALEAGTKALLDAGINYDDVQMGFAGYVFGDSTSGQRAFYQFGMTQIPIVNVNNNCSTGSTALWLGRNAILSGQCNVVMCLGFEEMAAGSLKATWTDRTDPLDLANRMMDETRGSTAGPRPAQLFGNAGIEYCEKYGATEDHLVKIAEVNHKHSVNNPYSQFRKAYSADEIRKSGTVHGPLTKLQCCPTSNGAAATILVSDAFLESHPKLRNGAIPIIAQEMATDSPLLFNRSAIELVGVDMTRRAANAVYLKSGIAPADIGVVELHDCFSANELVCIDALGLCVPGKAHELIPQDITFGGTYVINPSGGLISKGHPLGATGLAQCAELVWQMRGWASNRQVDHLRYALQHNVGLGGAVVVTLYGRPKVSSEMTQTLGEDGRARAGYNPAVECRGVTKAMFDRIKSREKFSDYMMREAKL